MSPSTTAAGTRYQTVSKWNKRWDISAHMCHMVSHGPLTFKHWLWFMVGCRRNVSKSALFSWCGLCLKM